MDIYTHKIKVAIDTLNKRSIAKRWFAECEIKTYDSILDKENKTLIRELVLFYIPKFNRKGVIINLEILESEFISKPNKDQSQV